MSRFGTGITARAESAKKISKTGTRPVSSTLKKWGQNLVVGFVIAIATTLSGGSGQKVEIVPYQPMQWVEQGEPAPFSGFVVTQAEMETLIEMVK